MKMMISRTIFKTCAVTLGMALSASTFALTSGSDTWVKETATYGPPNLQDAYAYVLKNSNPSVINGKHALHCLP
jgi:poly(3-hydroxybutyrate) depolymerase